VLQDLSPERSLRPLINRKKIEGKEQRMPTITQFTRFKSDKAEEMVKTAKQATIRR
jgi:hypothetical protein